MSTPCHDALMVRFILPVKDLRLAKTRLDVADRRAIVKAMLLDTIEAVVGAELGPVVLVSPDVDVAAIADAYGLGFVNHRGGLNEAISSAITTTVCAAILPDLPALRSDDVRALVASGSGFVPDAQGTGTTMAIAEPLVPLFGPGSAAAFEERGMQRLNAAATGRCDVDDVAALARAIRLGVGPNTREVLDARGPAHMRRAGPR
jgi:2-phospho-L-lactate/phosphoenolpyruvate guanylyltransferase